MAISELQIALIGAGVVAVVAVWGYNGWQERKHRQAAARILKGDQGDALLGSQDAATDSSERREPHFAEAADDLPEAESSGPETAPAAAAAPEPAQQTVEPPLPVECADSVADCVLHLAAADPLPAPAVWAIQSAWAGDLTKPLHWLARNEDDDMWRPVDSHDVGRYRAWAVALQLVDRRGPVSDGELGRFFDGIQQLARQTSVTLELPARGETLLRAAKLDEFCAAVDIQFVLHVVESSGGVFAGTKLRGVVEAAGLILDADGVFRARDDAGGELFTVANLGTERLSADSITSLATHGLTLSLDVPRVADGVPAFDHMLATARELATALGGVLVDAQRAPLSTAMIDAIRAKTAELQQRLRDGGIVPGSVRALRLFS